MIGFLVWFPLVVNSRDGHNELQVNICCLKFSFFIWNFLIVNPLCSQIVDSAWNPWKVFIYQSSFFFSWKCLQSLFHLLFKIPHYPLLPYCSLHMFSKNSTLIILRGRKQFQEELNFYCFADELLTGPSLFIDISVSVIPQMFWLLHSW